VISGGGLSLGLGGSGRQNKQRDGRFAHHVFLVVRLAVRLALACKKGAKDSSMLGICITARGNAC
jgi:hypothetical protein